MSKIKLFRKFFFLISNFIKAMIYSSGSTTLVTRYVGKAKIGSNVKK